MRNTISYTLIFALSCTTALGITFGIFAYGARRTADTESLISRNALSAHAVKILAIDTDTKMIQVELLDGTFGMVPKLIAAYKDVSKLEDNTPRVENGTVVGLEPSRRLIPQEIKAGDVGYMELAVAADGTFWITKFFRNDVLHKI